MRSKIIICFLLASVSIGVSAQQALDRYLEIAAKNSPVIRSAYNEYRASLENIPQAGVLPDPQIAFGYFISPVETRLGPQRAKISLNQMLPWFGTLDAREEVAVQQAKVKYEAFEEAKTTLWFEVKSAYFDLYFNSKAIDATRENIEILESLRNLALIKIESGSASGVDELRLELEMSDLENNLSFLLDRTQVLTVKFNNLINSEDNEPVEIPEILWNQELAMERVMLLDSIRINNHQVMGLKYSLDSYYAREELAKKSGLPELSFGLDYFVIGQSDNTSLAPSINGRDAFMFPRIGITIPLYRKKYSAMVNETVFMQQSVADKKEARVNMLETLFEKTYSEYSDAGRRIELFLHQIEIVDKALEILMSEYSTSGKNFEEILRMERRWLRYALELERARSDKLAAIAFIDYLSGK